MRKLFCFLTIVFIFSCGRQGDNTSDRIITVSIAPFKYFIEEIAEDDFTVNVMVHKGSDPHIYEPFPDQINNLRRSIGYISNGYLGFEMIWLERFYEVNSNMQRLSLGDVIDSLTETDSHSDHTEGADPHYWMSPRCGMIMASSIKEFLCELNPSHRQMYEANYQSLLLKIQELDAEAEELFSGFQNRSFMIFHPNLGYLARDYGLEEISIESEGKEPSPSNLKELIDHARKENLKTILVQREYDTKNARVIADEIGAELRIIDPLSEDWLKTISDIIIALHSGFIASSK